MAESRDSARLTVRAASASRSDGLVFARHLDEAQEGWYRMALGRSAPELIAGAFASGNHELSYEFVTIVERDGVPVGSYCAYSGSQHRRFGPNPLDEAAHGSVRYRAMKRLSSRMLTFIDQIPERDFYLRSIAVDPDRRGMGIGSVLLERLTEAGVVAGSERLALDVAASNKGGRRLYERSGFRVEAESPRFLGLPNTNVFRMVAEL